LPVTGGPIAPEEESPWAYRYMPTNQWKGSVESFLVWQNYLDLEDRDKGIQADRFQRIASAINQLLDQKRIMGVERGRVVIEVSSRKKHGLDDLSSGERQIVLLLVEITRHIKPRGIILIDEPEISLHPTWQRGLVVALDKIIEQYDAQVIMATHSVEIASMVLPYEVLFLSDLGLPLGEWKPEQEALA
jgi:predicted ATPase